MGRLNSRIGFILSEFYVVPAKFEIASKAF